MDALDKFLLTLAVGGFATLVILVALLAVLR